LFLHDERSTRIAFDVDLDDLTDVFAGKRLMLIFMLMQKCLILMLTHLQQAFDVDAFADCLVNINQILKAMICGIGEDNGRDCI
jgi:hypothetical protein